MPYLTLQDYARKIQSPNLLQVISSDDGLRLVGQAEALKEIRGYLAQKFDIDDQFRDTVKFDYNATYHAKQLVYLDADAYDQTATYALNALTLQAGNIYYCSMAITVAEVFTIGHWTLIGKQYDYFYIQVPQPEFDPDGTYTKDGNVFYNDSIYLCKRSTVGIGHSSELQYGEYKNIPLRNEFPDATGQTQWTLDEEYTVTNVWPTNTGSYTKGDNRDPLLVGMNVTIAIHKLSPRIATHVIPEIWVKNYDDAVSYLKRAAKGEVTLDIKRRLPRSQYGRMRWGSTVKNINNY